MRSLAFAPRCHAWQCLAVTELRQAWPRPASQSNAFAMRYNTVHNTAPPLRCGPSHNSGSPCLRHALPRGTSPSPCQAGHCFALHSFAVAGLRTAMPGPALPSLSTATFGHAAQRHCLAEPFVEQHRITTPLLSPAPVGSASRCLWFAPQVITTLRLRYESRGMAWLRLCSAMLR